jgi:hypothetical protein
LHGELTEICGAGWPWVPFGEEGAVDANHLTVMRWGTLWELIRPWDALWEQSFTRHWIPRVDVAFTVLARPPAPKRFRWQGPDEPLVASPVPYKGPIGIGGGVGGNFGSRYGRRGGLLRMGGAGAGETIDKGLAWISKQLDLGASGELSEGELYALLVFFGEVFELDGKAHGPTIEWSLTRLVLTLADRHAGRSEPPREIRLRALETLVLAEAELMGQGLPPSVRQALEWSVEGLVSAQNPTGSFSFHAGDARGDATTTALALLAFKTASTATHRAVEVDVKDAAAGAREWLRGAIERARGPVSSEERDPAAPTAEGCATAMTLLAMMLDGENPEGSELAPLVKWLTKNPPRLDRPDYLMIGTHAAFQVGGDVRDDWNREMKKHVPGAQLKDGSWPAAGPRDALATTALMILTLEAYYRYSMVGYGRAPWDR